MAENINIELTIGDTETLLWTFTDSNGDAYTITSNTFTFTIGSTEGASDILSKTGGDFTLSSNTASLELSTTDTAQTQGTYWYTASFVDSNSKKTTISHGACYFTKERTGQSNSYSVTVGTTTLSVAMNVAYGTQDAFGSNYTAAGDYIVGTGAAAFQVQTNNFTATAAPDSDNDTDEGYIVGSRWIDVTNDKEYVCLDNTDGAAVWTETTAGAAGGETNTASNVGSGTSVFKQKSGVDFEFNGIKSENNKIAVALDGVSNDIELTLTEGNIVHDNLSGFVANEHVDHTGVTLTAGTGLTGGGDISANRSFAVDVGIADDKILQVDDADAADNDYAKFTANGLEGRSYSEVKTDLSLNNVENTALSTWAGSSNITTLGTIGTGTWQGDEISDSYIANNLSILSGNIANSDITLKQSASPTPTGEGVIQWDTDDNTIKIGDGTGTKTFSDDSVMASTYAPIAKGVTNGDSHDHSGGDGAQIDHGGLAGLTDDDHTQYLLADGSRAYTSQVITDNAILTIDDLDAAQNDYCKLTANGVEGRSYSEVKTDLSLNNVENTALSTWAGSSNITTVGTIGTGTWQGTAIADAYVANDLTIAGGTIGTSDITLKQSTGPTNTAEGTVEWDTNDDLLCIGDGTNTLKISAVEHIAIACSDETTDLTTGTAKATFRMPNYATTLVGVRASCTTAPTGATLTIDINEAGTTVLSTKLTIDAGEKTSTTAATAAVISDSALAADAEMTVDIDQIGSSVAGAGLKVYLEFRRA